MIQVLHEVRMIRSLLCSRMEPEDLRLEGLTEVVP